MHLQTLVKIAQDRTGHGHTGHNSTHSDFNQERKIKSSYVSRWEDWGPMRRRGPLWVRTQGQHDASLGKSELCQGTGKMRSLETNRTNTAPGAPATPPPLPTISRSAVCSAAQSCPAHYDHMDWSPPGFSVHGILQARILEWIANSFSRGSSQLRDRALVSCIAGRFFTVWATMSFDRH